MGILFFLGYTPRMSIEQNYAASPENRSLQSALEKQRKAELGKRLQGLDFTHLGKLPGPEEFAAKRETLHANYGAEISQLALGAFERTRVLASQMQDPNFDPETSTKQTIERNVEFLKNAFDAGEDPWKGAFQETPELRKLSQADLDQVQTFLATQDVPSEYQPHIQVYLDHMRLVLSDVYTGKITEEAQNLGADKTIATYASLLHLRQNAFPLFSVLAKMETQKLRSTFEDIRSETVDFLKNAFPEIDQKTLEERAKRLSFSIKSGVESSEKWENVGGKFNPGTKEISVRRNYKLEEDTYRHEILHGLSQSEDRVDTKPGAITFLDTELSPGVRARLTEAVIEEMTQFGKINDASALHSYVSERKWFSNLRSLSEKQGDEIPLGTFVQALFSEEKNLRASLHAQGVPEKSIDHLFRRAQEEIS